MNMTVVVIVTTGNGVDHRRPPRQIGFLRPDRYR